MSKVPHNTSFLFKKLLVVRVYHLLQSNFLVLKRCFKNKCHSKIRKEKKSECEPSLPNCVPNGHFSRMDKIQAPIRNFFLAISFPKPTNQSVDQVRNSALHSETMILLEELSTITPIASKANKPATTTKLV